MLTMERYMNKWMLLFSLFSVASYSSSDFSTVDVSAPDLNSQEENALGYKSPDFNPPEVSLQEQQNIVCASVVCNSTFNPEAVPVVGEVPKREPNPTLDTIASAIYIVGEIGVAENLSTPEYEKFFEN